MEKTMVRPYVKIFIMSIFMHDPRGPSLCCWCGGYYPTWEMVALNVITWLACVVIELSTIIKIHKYRRLHEGHNFISMAMEVHNAPKRDMDSFIKDMPIFSTIDDQKVIYLYIFAFNFSSHMLVLLFNVL
jgi:hypothetical protein